MGGLEGREAEKFIREGRAAWDKKEKGYFPKKKKLFNEGLSSPTHLDFFPPFAFVFFFF